MSMVPSLAARPCVLLDPFQSAGSSDGMMNRARARLRGPEEDPIGLRLTGLHLHSRRSLTPLLLLLPAHSCRIRSHRTRHPLAFVRPPRRRLPLRPTVSCCCCLRLRRHGRGRDSQRGPLHLAAQGRQGETRRRRFLWSDRGGSDRREGTRGGKLDGYEAGS